MPDKQVRIDLVANDKASAKVEDVADEVERLEKLDPEVEITADTRQAERAIEDVSDEAKELTRKDQEFILRAKIGDAKAALKELQGDLDKTAVEAKTAQQAVDDIGTSQGPRLAGNTVADLTGPLGEASGAASDLGGVFDGLADIAEGAFIRMGASATSAAAVSGVLGGIGFAVAGVAAAYSYFSGKAKKAEQDQREFTETYKDFQDALKKGDVDDAADEFIKLHDGALKAADALGLTEEQFVNFVEGKGDLSALNEEWIRNTAIIDANASAIAAQQGYRDEAAIKREQEAATWLKLYDEVVKAKGAQDGANESTLIATGRHDAIAGALGRHATAADTAERHQKDLKEAVDKTKGALDKLKGALSMESAFLNFKNTATTALSQTGEEAELTQEEILQIKLDYIDVAEYFGLNPLTIKENLERIERGEVAAVLAETQGYFDQMPASVNTKLLDPTQVEITSWAQRNSQRMRDALAGYNVLGGGGGSGSTGRSATAPASVVNVTQHVPRGYRGDLLGDARTAARRSGGLYHRNRR